MDEREESGHPELRLGSSARLTPLARANVSLDVELSLLRVCWLRRALLAALVILYLGWIGYQVAVRRKLYDFNLYYVAAAAFRDDIDVYALVPDYSTTNKAYWDELAAHYGIVYIAPPYRYPPLTAQLVLPLSLLSPQLAGALWLALTAAAFIASAWLLGASSDRPESTALACGLLLMFVPPLATLHAGQVNGFLLLALCLALYGMSRRREALTGIGLALGFLLKLIPVALIFYLPWRRMWRAAAVAVVLALILLMTAPLVLGPGVLRSYANSFLSTGQPGVIFQTGANQSLNGFWGRLLDGRADNRTVYAIYLASAILVVLGTVAVCWPWGRRARGHKYEFAVIVCALQLITPYTWYHQLVLLLIPLFILASAIIDGDAPSRWTIPLAVGYVATDLHGMFWHQLASSALLSMPFYTTVMLWAMLSVLAVNENRRMLAQEL